MPRLTFGFSAGGGGAGRSGAALAARRGCGRRRGWRRSPRPCRGADAGGPAAAASRRPAPAGAPPSPRRPRAAAPPQARARQRRAAPTAGGGAGATAARRRRRHRARGRRRRWRTAEHEDRDTDGGRRGDPQAGVEPDLRRPGLRAAAPASSERPRRAARRAPCRRRRRRAPDRCASARRPHHARTRSAPPDRARTPARTTRRTRPAPCRPATEPAPAAMQISSTSVPDRLALERPPPEQALERDHAQRPDVGAEVDGLHALRLLGAHVVRRAEQRAGPRLGDRRHAEADDRRLRDAEVEHLGQLFLLVLDEEDVVGLQIAVDDADLVRARDARARCASGCAPHRRATDARPCAGAPPATRPRAAPSRCTASSPSTPWSRICTTCGLRSAAAARASRMKRPSASGLLAICGSISLIATGDCSVRWCASHTDPMPPLPSRWTSLYLPARTWAPDAFVHSRSTVTAAPLARQTPVRRRRQAELQGGRFGHAGRWQRSRRSRSWSRCSGSADRRCRTRRSGGRRRRSARWSRRTPRPRCPSNEQ